jgi:hypothetical protein
VNTEFAVRFAFGSPSLPDGLRAQTCSVSALLQAMLTLDASIDNLYRSLTPQQRQRADRLLGPVCAELESMLRSVHW